MPPVALRHMGRTSGARQLHQVAGEPVRLAVTAPSDSSGDPPGRGMSPAWGSGAVSASPASLDGVGQPLRNGQWRTSTPLAGERRDVASVVVQARKIVMRYAAWRAEERGAVRGRSGRHPVRPGAAARRSSRLGRLATYFGRSGPAGRSPARKRRARLPSMSIWPICRCLKAAADPPGPRRERDGTQNSTGAAAASDKGARRLGSLRGGWSELPGH